MTKNATLHKLTAIIAGSVFLLMGLASLPPSIPDAEVSGLTEGKHYQRVSDQPLANADITIFFWYGCPHCYRVYQAMERDKFFNQAELSKLTIRKVPVALNKDWEEHAKLFYAFELSGMSIKGHMEVMDEIQRTHAVKGVALDNVIQRVIEKEKTRNKQFKANLSDIQSLMSSKRIQVMMTRDSRLSDKAQLKGVPTLLVKGEYTATLGSGVSYSDLPVIALKLAKGEE